MGLIADSVGGDRRALARLASMIEADGAEADAVFASLPRTPLAPQTIGVTGPPGAGKSSLINMLIDALVKRGDNVAVLLVDPSSPFSGGAVLGDRVRMDEWPDDRVFIRSLASRGWEGGLAPSTAFMIRLFGAAGFGRIIVESVGVGQDAVDVREIADTTIVVQVPNLGDTVQTLKAGILEIADIFVVNKADLPGSATTVRELNSLLRLVDVDTTTFATPVIPVSATERTGLDALVRAIDDHANWLAASPAARRSEERQTSWFLRKSIEGRVRSLSREPEFQAVRDAVLAGAITPRLATRQVAEILIER